MNYSFHPAAEARISGISRVLRIALEVCAQMAYTTCLLSEMKTMAIPERTKQERLHIRLDALSKQKLERAASYLHKNLSDFILSQALTSADRVIREHESLTLSPIDWDVFVNALENPPKPNQKLQRAFQLHKQHIK